MNRIRKYGIGLLTMVMMLFTVSSCDLTELDINDDPNNPAQASLNLLLTNIQLNASSTLAGGLNSSTMGFMAVTDATDGFDMSNSSWNGTWNFLYANPLKDLNGMLKVTKAARDAGNPLPYYEGIAKSLQAYYFSTMVDLWGNVPYFEAFEGDGATAILAPKFDDGQLIYADLIQKLDEAITHFGEANLVAVQGDLMYSGSATRWRGFAKSLKLRLLLQESRALPSVVADINALVNDADLISTATGDAQFTFGRLRSPDDRHPIYQSGYAATTAGYNYFGHQYMYEMLQPLTVGGTVPGDPRIRFYFKRQTSTVLNPDDPTDLQTIPCSQRTDCVYGYFPLSDLVAQGLYGVNASALSSTQKTFLAGYFGRDRSDPSGIPNDNPIRTSVGLYPFAGLYDDVAQPAGRNRGTGDGIFPMLTSWMVKLYKIEANLALGSPLTGDDAQTLFRKAMEEQFAKVNSFVGTRDPDAVAITTAARDAYVNAQLAKYTAATSDANRLRVVMKQAWFLNFGNGYEMYNTFRRTGLPDDIQTPMQPPRQFALRLPYAQDEINLNPNTPVVVFDSPTDAVFWDVLKFQF